MSDRLCAEVVFALPDTQVLIEVSLPAGATVQNAIDASGLAERFPDQPLDEMQVGVWGKTCRRDATLRDGDRVEFYRPLRLDPRAARRQLAEVGRTMSEPRGAPDTDNDS